MLEPFYEKKMKGGTALDAIRAALEGKPWLPQIPGCIPAHVIHLRSRI
jgi:hypothetical protein